MPSTHPIKKGRVLTENTSTLTSSVSELRDVLSSQLQLFLEHKNYDGAKVLLIPVQPVDIAEAIALLPEALQAIAFRLLDKTKAIEVYEYLQFEVQQYLLEQFQTEEAGLLLLTSPTKSCTVRNISSTIQN